MLRERSGYIANIQKGTYLMWKEGLDQLEQFIALTRGLQVNDSAEQYPLRSIPGKFSGLHLLCIEYVGFQIIDPKVDIGFDLSAEYATARAMFGKGK
jgi:hypothetical protein